MLGWKEVPDVLGEPTEEQADHFKECRLALQDFR